MCVNHYCQEPLQDSFPQLGTSSAETLTLAMAKAKAEADGGRPASRCQPKHASTGSTSRVLLSPRLRSLEKQSKNC